VIAIGLALAVFFGSGPGAPAPDQEGDIAPLAARALHEDDRDKRQALVAQLRRLDFAAVEKAVRQPSRGPTTIELGKVVERTCRSDLDGEAFGYALHLPPNYSPAQRWPVIVSLHGTNQTGLPNAGSYQMASWLRCAAAKEKCVLLSPTTVKHTWNTRAGHAYVLTALREIMEELNVDPDRIYLDGMSMGAGGTFRLAEHHPDRWAAIAPRCNVPDIRQKKDKSYITMLAENFRMVPLFWVVGAKDQKIAIELARAAKLDVEAARGELVYHEYPEGGHDWSLEKDDDVLAWYEKHVRNPYPEELVYKSYEKIFGRAWWIEVTKRNEPQPVIMVHLDMNGQESERRSEYRPPVLVRAKRKGNAIDVTCEEVKELRLWLDDALVDLDKPVTISVNGRKLHEGVVKRSVDTLIEEARRRRDPSMTFSAYVDVKPK
jgi:pimeloyl-ACP methyl ester carboxylesterase